MSTTIVRNPTPSPLSHSVHATRNGAPLIRTGENRRRKSLRPSRDVLVQPVPDHARPSTPECLAVTKPRQCRLHLSGETRPNAACASTFCENEPHNFATMKVPRGKQNICSLILFDLNRHCRRRCHSYLRQPVSDSEISCRRVKLHHCPPRKRKRLLQTALSKVPNQLHNHGPTRPVLPIGSYRLS